MRILAVDDDVIILDLLKEVLVSIGHDDITTCGSAHEALDLLNGAHQPFDCILLDIQMPKMDGIELCGLLRQMSGYHDVPILMLTAMSERRYFDRAFSAGATDYITKPFDIVELDARIQVARKLADSRQRLTQQVASIQREGEAGREAEKIALEEAFAVRDVDGVMAMDALWNYLAQLGRSSLFGSSVVAFKINGIDRLYESMSAFEYICAITDAAEAIASSLPYLQCLTAYAGNGVFITVAGSTQTATPQTVIELISQEIDLMELCYSDGRPMLLSLRMSEPVHLSFLAGKGHKRAILDAVFQAETAPAADSHALGIHERRGVQAPKSIRVGAFR